MLLPTLNGARKRASATQCMSNLRQIGQATVMYSQQNRGWIIPSYTMSGVTGGATVPLEGWAPILDRDGYIKGRAGNENSVFLCPDTLDIEGMKGGQTGSDPGKPKGWMDWPNLRLGVDNVPTTIPDHGFNKVIRVGYWINADNPIGSATTVTPDVYYTCSVGYGPGTNGKFLSYQNTSRIRRPGCTITFADGVYAGRQRDTRLGTTNSRIGYRHPNSTANVAFADGHVEQIPGNKFPRGTGGAATMAEVQEDNYPDRPTVYLNPERTLGP
jgi:prepilin-type processing-associated H-X9-DG protein